MGGRGERRGRIRAARLRARRGGRGAAWGAAWGRVWGGVGRAGGRSGSSRRRCRRAPNPSPGACGQAFPCSRVCAVRFLSGGGGGMCVWGGGGRVLVGQRRSEAKNGDYKHLRRNPDSMAGCWMVEWRVGLEGGCSIAKLRHRGAKPGTLTAVFRPRPSRCTYPATATPTAAGPWLVGCGPNGPGCSWYRAGWGPRPRIGRPGNYPVTRAGPEWLVLHADCCIVQNPVWTGYWVASVVKERRHDGRLSTAGLGAPELGQSPPSPSFSLRTDRQTDIGSQPAAAGAKTANFPDT